MCVYVNVQAWITGVISSLVIFHTHSLENGLARTPPMGWLAWTRFMCNIDCKKYPNDCISEKLFKDMADIMVAQGYKDIGYNQVNIDDCWATRVRDKEGRLVSDPVRFASGIPALAEYMHERGLKLGIYANYGEKTCMGFPGTTEADMSTDAETFASFNVDMLKFDGCFNDPSKLDGAYPKMGKALNHTGRKLIYSCSWPYYVRTQARREPDYKAIADNCNLWRNFDDIQISFASVLSIVDFYDAHQDQLSAFHGPGHWNDPDMLIVGNPQLTVGQARAQMALWAIWSAPLLMSNDLRDMAEGHKEVLLNKMIVAINQDPLGIMGKRVMQKGSIGIYVKRIHPIVNGDPMPVYSYAVVLFNRGSERKEITIKLSDIGITAEQGYHVEELFSSHNHGLLKPADVITVTVAAEDAMIFKCTASDVHDDALPDQKDLLKPQTVDGDHVNWSKYWPLWLVSVVLISWVLMRCRRSRVCQRLILKLL